MKSHQSIVCQGIFNAQFIIDGTISIKLKLNSIKKPFEGNSLDHFFSERWKIRRDVDSYWNINWNKNVRTKN